MSEGTTTSLIVVLQGSKNVEQDGRIIVFGSGANINTVRGLATEKLGIAGSTPTDNVLLRDGNGRLLDGIDQVRQQQVVYVDLQDQIKDVIPGPRSLPFIGALREFMPNMTEGWIKMFQTYGPLVDATILSSRTVATNDPAIAELFAKESEYFTKKLNSGLQEIKAFGGSGLFTTNTDEEDWKLAHKLLMPAFSPRAIKAYTEEMGKISQQTIEVLSGYQPTETVEILDWTTKLTFETIGRIGFGYDFGLLDSRDAPPHPFIEAMAYCLKEAVTRIQQPQVVKHLPLDKNRRFETSIKLMNDTVDQVIADRKSGPDAGNLQKDLLGFMLNARDEHNLGLSDENIRYQVVTFLIAGHDTTANTLAWTLYELSRNPDVEAKVLQEIANVGIRHDAIPTTEQVSNLKYIHQVLKETLRRYPPVRMLGKYCKKDCIVPGGYRIRAGTHVGIHLMAMHLNPKVYPDPFRYDPDRWTPEEEQKRSRFAWLPFSTGPRACIGQAFALQEAKIVLAMWLHRFKFCYDGPEIQYDPMMATTKPMNLHMTIHPRTDMPAPNADLKLSVPSDSESESRAPSPSPHAILAKMPAKQAVDVELPNTTFLYGTQTGTAQDYANQLASQARSFGFKNVTMCEMDKWKILDEGRYESKTSGPQDLVVICTATYNGQPPDSAERFDKFLTEKTADSSKNKDILKSLRYAVFGVGNKNWRTYQAFPRRCDDVLEELGAERFFPPGEGNADADMDAQFNEWCAHFWTHALSSFGISMPEEHSIVPAASAGSTETTVAINFVNPSDKEKWQAARSNRNGEYNAQLIENKELQQEGSGRSTRHIELDISHVKPLDGNHAYKAGDHLEIMPENSPAVVEAIALSFGWVLDSVFEINTEKLSGVSPRSLAAAIKGPCTVRNALTYYADLASPPSRTMLSIFAQQLQKASPETAEQFRRMVMPDNPEYTEFVKKHRTLLDLQRAYPQVNQLDLGQFLSAVSVMQPRRYSIASSPYVHPTHAHLSVGVVHDILKDGREYYGLASSYLARSASPTTVRAALKSSKSSFGLPADPATPIIMIAAGTGLAPFRGFLQERAWQREQGQQVGDCVLVFGCRRKDHDYIYADELQGYLSSGVLSGLFVAFSRQVLPSPVKYVQHQLLANAGTIWELVAEKNASIYVCGAGAMSRDVRRTFNTMAKSFGVASTDDEAEEYIGNLLEQGRYNEDVWG